MRLGLVSGLASGLARCDERDAEWTGGRDRDPGERWWMEEDTMRRMERPLAASRGEE